VAFGASAVSTGPSIGSWQYAQTGKLPGGAAGLEKKSFCN
jgi:hypothetical protein